MSDDRLYLPRSASVIPVRARLTFWNVGILAFALLLFGAALRGIIGANLNAAVDRDLLRQAQTHQMMTARWFGSHGGSPGPPPGGGPPPNAMGQAPPGGGPPPEFTPAGMLPTRLLNLRELRLMPWSVNMAWDPDTFPKSAHGQDVYSTILVKHDKLRVLSVPLRQTGHIVGVVQTAESLASTEREMRHLTRALLTLIPLVLVIAGAGGALLTGRTLRPVREVTQAATQHRGRRPFGTADGRGQGRVLDPGFHLQRDAGTAGRGVPEDHGRL